MSLLVTATEGSRVSWCGLARLRGHFAMGHGIALFGEKSEAVVELRGLTISVYLPRSKSRAVAKMCDAADKPCWTKPPGEAVDCCSRPIGDCNLYAFLRKLWPEVALTLVIWLCYRGVLSLIFGAHVRLGRMVECYATFSRPTAGLYARSGMHRCIKTTATNPA